MGPMIHFGTDGWRARLDGDFTEENVVRVARAAGEWWARSTPGAVVYVGYDARPQARDFARLAARVLAGAGLVAMLSDRFIPTPALSWTIAHDARACGGFMITGSHNPADYLGVKLRIADGGTGTVDFMDEIEELIEPEATEERGPIIEKDLITHYLDHLTEAVDGERIAAAHLKVVYDPMYGSARGYLPAVLGALGVAVEEIHGIPDGDYGDMRPEPIEPWVDDCERAVVACQAQAGLINDGDADRVGAVDEKGTYVSPHKIIALVMGHLVRHRGMSGRVVLNLSTSMLPRRTAEALGCRVDIKPIGFKYIYSEMRRGDVLIGGEEAGGIGVPAHFPERDGLLINLLLVELMAQTGKTLGELVHELEQKVGSYCYARRDLRLPPELIESLRTVLPGLNPHRVAGKQPIAVSHMDGLRLDFSDRSWLLLRPGGTEPVVRIYGEAATIEERDDLLEAGVALARGGMGESL